jgi:hypothetical protein
MDDHCSSFDEYGGRMLVWHHQCGDVTLSKKNRRGEGNGMHSREMFDQFRNGCTIKRSLFVS